MTDHDDITMDLPESVDEPALRRIRTVARLLDDAVRIPGTDIRVGLDPMLSAVPSPVGDAAGAVLSLYIVLEAANLGVPYTTVVRMLANVGIDAAGGSVPVIGTLFDAAWKANKRNLSLLERHLEDRDDQSGGDGLRGQPIEVEPSG